MLQLDWSSGRRIIGTGMLRFFCPFLCLFSTSQVSSASSPPPTAQTGTDLPMNVPSRASHAPDIVGVAAVSNTAGTLFGRSRGSHPPPHGDGEHGCRVGSVDAPGGGGGCAT